MFETSAAKTAAVAFSIVGVFFTTPALFAIILYEKNNHHRTLINQVSIL
jgi:hypothetical protein